jgi:hypothetical protein
VSAAEKGASLQHATRRANTSSDRHLRLVTDSDAHASVDSEPRQTRAKPALAVWRLERTSKRALPSNLARQLIAHYTNRGDLVLASRRSGNEALRQATRLGRRAVPLEASNRQGGDAAADAEAVIALRPNEGADLAIAALNVNASERHATQLAAQLLARLKPGAFLVLALEEGRDCLGAIVHACQQNGLQYWQHVVALDPAAFNGELSGEDADAAEGRRSIRCHRDLLVLRRPGQADAPVGKAAAVTEVAA